MQLSPIRKKRLAAASVLVSVSFLVYALGPSEPPGPPYRDESLTAGPEPLMLALQPSVREELHLTNAQVEQIKGIREQRSNPQPRAPRMGRKHQEAALKGVLSSEQATRLYQITLQQQGGLALNNARTAEELGLTEDQRKKADGILAKLTKRLALSREARDQDASKQAEQAEQSRAAAGKDLLSLLTSLQQQRWKDLTGEPFKGKIEVGVPGGFGFPGGFGPPGFGPPGGGFLGGGFLGGPPPGGPPGGRPPG